MAGKAVFDTIDTIEKVLRYAIPGFLFVLLYRMSYPPSPGSPLSAIGDKELYIFIPFVGIAIYSVHRVLFDIVDFVLNRIRYGTLDCVAKHTRARFGDENRELRNYMYYRWAIIHCCCIFAELLIFFSVFHEDGTFFSQHTRFTLFGGVVLFVLCFVVYWITHKLHRKLFDTETK